MDSRELLLQAARGLKRSLVVAGRSTGIERRISRSSWRQQRLCILCYHGVSLADEHKWLPGLFVTPRFLRRRLELLRELGCTVLPLGDAVAMLREGSLPPMSVVLTFDDGFYDFYAEAMPILQDLDMPATNYVSTYYVENQRPLLHLGIRYMLWNRRNAEGVELRLAGDERRFALTRREGRRQAFHELMRRAKRLDDDRPGQTRWIRGIAESIGFDWGALEGSRVLGLMRPEELREATALGFDMQLHTHRHRTPRDEASFVEEIQTNKRIMEEITGRPTTHFCYPSGDYDRCFLPWLRAAGIETATVGVSALARDMDDPLLLPRYIDTMLQSESTFCSWVTGLNDRLRLRDREA